MDAVSMWDNPVATLACAVEELEAAKERAKLEATEVAVLRERVMLLAGIFTEEKGRLAKALEGAESLFLEDVTTR